MQIKDYYTILGIAPAATLQEIKQSFRRLALRYHPDKNHGDPLAEAHFREIQEAYKVLSDPQQRSAYNYKRWYNRSIGMAFGHRPVTADELLAESHRAANYVASMNIFQVDYDGLSYHIRQLLTDNAIGILQQHANAAQRTAFIQSLLKAAVPLPLRYTTAITSSLEKIANDDEASRSNIHNFIKEKKWQEQWHRYKWMVVVVVILLIGWLMWAVAK